MLSIIYFVGGRAVSDGNAGSFPYIIYFVGDDAVVDKLFYPLFLPLLKSVTGYGLKQLYYDEKNLILFEASFPTLM